MAILNSFCLNLLLESHRDLLIASQLLRPIIIHVLLQLGDVKVFMHSCDLPVQLTSASSNPVHVVLILKSLNAFTCECPDAYLFLVLSILT